MHLKKKQIFSFVFKIVYERMWRSCHVNSIMPARTPSLCKVRSIRYSPFFTTYFLLPYRLWLMVNQLETHSNYFKIKILKLNLFNKGILEQKIKIAKLENDPKYYRYKKMLELNCFEIK